MSDGSFQLYLASKSPRRKLLLAQMGPRFETLSFEIDEVPVDNESAVFFAERMALAKALAGSKIAHASGVPVLGCDTCIELDKNIIGKPDDKMHAFDILCKLSGREHAVISAMAVCDGHKTLSLVQSSRVSMRIIQQKEMETYWASGEPKDKAGAYAIQGLGALFVNAIEGSYSGIMGLPIYETAQLLKEFGVECMQSKEKQ